MMKEIVLNLFFHINLKLIKLRKFIFIISFHSFPVLSFYIQNDFFFLSVCCLLYKYIYQYTDPHGEET